MFLRISLFKNYNHLLVPGLLTVMLTPYQDMKAMYAQNVIQNVIQSALLPAFFCSTADVIK